MIKNLSVFFPLFNEEGNVETTVQKAIDVLEKRKLEYEIILVNDGSTDGTKKVTEKLATQNPKIKAINHEKNLGYGEALKSGFYNAKYDTIVYTDGDGQFDFSEIDKFLEKIEENDLVIGYRIKRQDPPFRTVFKQGWKLSLFAFFGLTLKDVDCGFKMVKRSVLEKIPRLQSQRGAMINPELAISAKKYGFKIAQVGVNHYPRLSGKPTGAGLRVILKSYLDLLRLWWKFKDQKQLFIFLVAILALAAFLRFYRIEEYMLFLGDEGRDALIVKDMVEGKHFPLIGPPTSVGNIYLGPLYYYMMYVPMAIFNLNPVSAAAMNALIGVGTVFLIYFLGKKWFGREAGLIASFLYAISPVTINYSNFSWNPNPTPFFILVTMWGLYQLNKTGNFLWLTVTGFSVAAACQMHYLALIFIPVAFILWVHEVIFRKYYKRQLKNVFWGTILGLLAFLTLMSPLFLFDLRHEGLNYKAVTALFESGEPVKLNLISNITKIPQIYSQSLIGRYMAGQNSHLTSLLSLLILLPLVFALIKRVKNKFLDWPHLALFIWLLVGLLGLSFYQYEIFDHYLGFLNPVPFLLFGSLFSLQIPSRSLKKIFLLSLLALVITLAFVNFQKNPFHLSPNNQLERSQQVSSFIIEKAAGADFNFALLSENNYDSAYVFFLEIYTQKNGPGSPSNKQLPFENTGQLFVVCEDAVCDPTHSPKYEIAAFGWSKVEWMEEYFGVKIYKLIANPSGKPDS